MIGIYIAFSVIFIIICLINVHRLDKRVNAFSIKFEENLKILNMEFETTHTALIKYAESRMPLVLIQSNISSLKHHVKTHEKKINELFKARSKNKANTDIIFPNFKKSKRSIKKHEEKGRKNTNG